MTQTRILFVCHGNICRSTAAEMVLKQMAREQERQDLGIASAAATREEIGNDIYLPMKKALLAAGYRCEPHAARQMTRSDYDRYDYIIGMDRANIRNILKITGGDPDHKISMLLDHTERAGQEVADPWYTGDFEATWKDVLAGCVVYMDVVIDVL